MKPNVPNPLAHDENIPPELRNTDRWVTWRPVPKPGGKVAKVPSPKVNAAKLLSYEEAKARAPADGGIGFVFDPGGNITGLDIDDFGTYSARDLIRLALRIRAYIECSPSGKGAHIIVRGRPPADAIGSPPGVDTVRPLRPGFFTITADCRWGEVDDLVDGQALLDKLEWPRRSHDTPVTAPGVDPGRANEVLHLLTYIDPGCDEHTWFKVLAALRDGLGDEVGLPLAKMWSRGALHDGKQPENYKSAEDVAMHFRSAKRGHGVGLGTIVHLARQGGYVPPQGAQSDPADVFSVLPEPANEPEHRPARIIRLSQVVRVRYEWLWIHRIPYCYITLVVGDPEVGKSIMLMDVVARLSVGLALPGQEPLPPMDVLLLNAEDGADDVIRGRIEAAGGDTNRIHVLNVNGAGQVQLPDDVEEVERYLGLTKARLVVLDPLDTAIPTKLDTHKSQHVRSALTPLWQVAKRKQAALVCVVHMKKKTGDDIPAMQRILGSIGLPAAARSTMFVIRADPADKDGPRQVVQDKSSHARHGDVPTLQFKVEDVPDPVFRGDRIPLVRWIEDALVPVDASVALTRTVLPRDAAGEWLAKRLEAGPVLSATLDAEAKRLGIARRTLFRIKDELGVQARRRGGSKGAWEWYLVRFEEVPEGVESL